MGYRLYMVSDHNTITTICKNVKNSTICNEQDEPSGFFIGWYYCGYIFEKTSKDSAIELLYCMCTKKQLKELQKKSDVFVKETDETIELYTRKGHYYHLHYTKRELICTDFSARESQKEIMTSIIDYYNKKRTCVAMISGQPGTGKSMMGILLAKELKGSLCKTYSPISPGDTLENIYNKVNPTKSKPLIIILDEFDVILHTFQDNLIMLHKDIPTEVYNKITWNNLLDDINLQLYPNLILILTSNMTKQAIEEKYDPSFVREKRVNVFVSL